MHLERATARLLDAAIGPMRLMALGAHPARLQKEAMEGFVFNIQRFTVHDGPGIRTEVFLKGCPFSCPWCSNPESHALHPEPGVYASRCLGRDVCGLCEQAMARAGLLAFDDDGRICSICREPDSCWEDAVAACPTGALKVWGELMNVDAVMRIIERDRRYYETSGGGVTVSGGEPLVQAAFAQELLARCREAGIRTCLESTLHGPWDALEALLRVSDLLIADFKCDDARRHERFVGCDNLTVKENLLRAATLTDQIIVRVPVIPGFNDDEDELAAIRDFLTRNLLGRILEVQVLEFMHLGEEKRRSLEQHYPYEGNDFNREELHGTVLAMQRSLQACGFDCTLGGVRKG